jgi:dipeptidyl-peptidase-3
MWGDIEDHKESQREWVQDMQPSVEGNLGWIEKYVDPEN